MIKFASFFLFSLPPLLEAAVIVGSSAEGLFSDGCCCL